MAGFQSLVAWRYLMANPRKMGYLAWIGVALALVALPLVIAGHAGQALPQAWLQRLLEAGMVPEFALPWIAVAATAVMLFCGAVAAYGYYFTFSTAVPLSGLTLGSMALVIIMSVMNGFESDLRSKVLGNTAHIRITRHDGPLRGWQDVQASIDKTPGVAASMAYLETEGVVGANRQFIAVLFRGIDPRKVAQVNQIARSLEDPEALGRMLPLVEDPNVVPLAPSEAPTPQGAAVDPAPADLMEIEPKDFSADSAPPAAASPTAEVEPPPLDLRVQDHEFATSGDAANRAADADRGGFVADPDALRRADMLPGMLVGRELARTLALYTGREVTAVSPLSDPANPDANGNPIPFNRDFRVAGVFHSGYYEYDYQLVYVTLEALQSFLDLDDQIDGFEVRVDSLDDVAAVAKQLATQLGPDFRVQSYQEINKSLFSALKVEKIGMFLIVGLIMLVAGFAIVGNLYMVVVQKAREISLLKAVGATDASIVRVFLTQGLIIGLLGAGLGVAIGLWTCRDVAVLKPRISSEVYYMDFMPVHVDYVSVGLVFVAGLLISMAATLYPVWLTTQNNPATGLKRF